MRISDWSSDVCSSDLLRRQRRLQVAAGAARTVLAVGRTALARGRRGDRAALVGARCGRRLAIPDRSATPVASWRAPLRCRRSEEHTSELQSLMRISYAVFCLKKKKNITYSGTYETHYNQPTNTQ